MTHATVVLASRSPRTVARRWARSHSLRRHWDRLRLVAFVLAVFVTGASLWLWPQIVPHIVLAPWVVLAALFLPVRDLLFVYAIATVFLLGPVVGLVDTGPKTELAFLGVVALMGTMYVLAESRARLGIIGLTGESMLVDLRERLEGSSRIPDLPAGWRAELAIRSAHGEAFAGDFLVTALSEDNRLLEVVLVDVSGKGRQAGSRSLHLSGALSGLLGSVPPADFLSAANSYLVRQRWEEGFATAVHLAVDLHTGAYAVGRAGHPPSALFRQGSGAWEVDITPSGPVLGIPSDVRYERAHGVLGPGDALLIYSDGVIESPGRDLADGVDRMLGVAARAVVRDALAVADEVVSAAPSGMSDDRAAFVLRRT